MNGAALDHHRAMAALSIPRGAAAMSVGGMRVFISPDRPGYVLPADVPVTDEFRSQFNAWAAGFFTPKNLVREGEALIDNVRNCIYVTPRTSALLAKESSR